MLQASFTIPFGFLELRWIIALWTVSLLSSQSSLPSSLAAETLAGWNFHLLPSLVCTNLPAPSHTGHMSPKHQEVHKPRPFIFPDVKLFPPCFKTQIKCQLLCNLPTSHPNMPLVSGTSIQSTEKYHMHLKLCEFKVAFSYTDITVMHLIDPIPVSNLC
jgi:hypothetical protein